MIARPVLALVAVALLAMLTGCGVGIIHGRELFTPEGRVGRLYHGTDLPANQWEMGAAPSHVTFQENGMIVALSVEERASNAIVVGWIIPMIPIALGGPPPIDSSVVTISVSHTPLGPEDVLDYAQFGISSPEFGEVGPTSPGTAMRWEDAPAGSLVHKTLVYETGVPDLKSFTLRVDGIVAGGRPIAPVELTFVRDRSPVWAIYSMNA